MTASGAGSSSSSGGRNISVERELAGVEVLIVDADPAVQRGFEQLLAPSGLPVTAAAGPEKALELIADKVFGVVVIDCDTPAPNAGIALVEKVRERSPTTLVFVLLARKAFDAAVAAHRAGAHDVILKAPDQVDYLRARVVDAAGDWVTRTGTGRLFGEVLTAFDEVLKSLLETERRATELEDKTSGRDARAAADDEVRILFVDNDDRLYRAMSRAGTPYQFSFAHTGGEALDNITKTAYQFVLVGPTLPDLPPSMILKTLKAQAPDSTLIAYEPNGRLDIVEPGRTIPIVEKFTAATQLVERLAELADAHRAQMRERRHLQVFRERHYELLHRLAGLKKKIERAIEDGKDKFTMPGGG
jgi:DNA-binding NtrC family response regulator